METLILLSLRVIEVTWTIMKRRSLNFHLRLHSIDTHISTAVKPMFLVKPQAWAVLVFLHSHHWLVRYHDFVLVANGLLFTIDESVTNKAVPKVPSSLQ